VRCQETAGDLQCTLVRDKNGELIADSHILNMWSGVQSSRLQIQRSGFDSLHYQIFCVVGLERGPLSLVGTIEELTERKSTGFGLENRDYSRRDPSR
jgi:hypothetical protein